MAVEELKNLLELLKNTPEVTELSVKGSSGAKVTLKRQPTAIQLAAEPEPEYSDEVITEESYPIEVATRKQLTITATMVGLFHETNPPLIPGSPLVANQIVGYIESMRLMNEVISPFDGTVDSPAIADGQPVEYGQPLFSVV